MTLAEDLDAYKRVGGTFPSIPQYVRDNLSPKLVLRPYQEEAIGRFLYYRDTYPQRREPAHLMFHMATGSGKTLLMAALILELYARGHRNFLFFVNATQIVEKTKANFLDAASSKYLFAETIRFAGRRIEVKEVANFEGADADAINIHFTTIQGLHSSYHQPKENAPNFAELAEIPIVMLADEGHHLNALTRSRMTLDDQTDARDWETMVQEIFRQNPANLLLEFSATAGTQIPAVAAKYSDKIIIDYALREFRADRYSKEIELIRTDVCGEDRMLQAVLLSQLRRKRAAAHGLSLKPVILFKSKNIAPSNEAESAFNRMIAGLDGERLEAFAATLPPEGTIAKALRRVLDDGDDAAVRLADEIRLDFASEKVRNVNSAKDLERQQIELNSLEDRDNEVRVVFAVDKLNEGWDVLNLFDIVRLYDQGTNATTNQEAQLIGRGARYWPFVSPADPDEPADRRKFDHDEGHPLRLLEQLHYHCSHDPAYLRDIRKVLVEQGLVDKDAEKAVVRIKPNFRQSDFFERGLLFANSQRRNARSTIFSLDDYQVEELIRLNVGHSGRTSEGGAFDAEETSTGGRTVKTRSLGFIELGRPVVRHAMDANPFFHFASLKRHFPKLKGIAEFIDSAEFLGGVTVEVSGPKDLVEALSQRHKLDLTLRALEQIEAKIVSRSHDHVGSRRFDPAQIKERFGDVELTVGGPHRKRWCDDPANIGVDLNACDWFAHDDFYGTSEEMALIRFVAGRIDQLRQDHGEVRMMRNEKALKLYDFDQGRGFEPDFLLFLERGFSGEATLVQIFMEPKGKHLAAGEAWKNDFLEAIERQAELPGAYASSHRLIGLPFFTESDWPMARKFREAQAPFRHG